MLAELSAAPRLIDCLRKQTFKDIDIYVCVNQPDDWWENDKMQPLCNENAMLLQWLKEQTDITIHIIDKSSRGKGWDNKKKGVSPKALKHLYHTNGWTLLPKETKKEKQV